jgi:NADH-quinone oxidoreductase subunit N
VGEPATVPLAVEIDGPLAIDLLALMVRGLVLGLGLLFVLIAARRSSQEQGPEFLGTLLLAITGLMIVASARDLVLLFLGLELISIPTYILLYLGRRDAASQESAAKYFYLSILSSALLLYGFSFVYGAAGSTSLVDIRSALAKTAGDSDWTQVVAALGLVLVFAGLGFKIAAVPFHFYAPDVYQGTTNANAGLLAVLPKVAGIVGLVRIVAVAMPGSETYAWRLAVILALLTMTVGNVMALWQNNVRRLLAYSSIAHGGYLLIGLAVAFVAAAGADVAAGFDGLSATLLYLVVYVLATTGAFAALAYLGDEGSEVSTVDELAGLGRGHPWAARPAFRR